MNCDCCEKEIPIGLAICPHCGRPQSAPGQSGKRFLWFMATMVGMFGIAVAEHYLSFRP
jgi:predicted amidophosphoribosyltransferase